MIPRHPTLTLILGALLLTTGCGEGGGGTPSETPAKVQNAVAEAQLTTLTLSAQAETRLGIETAAVELRRLAGTREVGGEVITLPGGGATLTAPVAGIVLGPQGGSPVGAGARVSSGQALLRLIPSPPDHDLLTAREEFQTRRAEYERAQAQLVRAEQMLADRAGSVRQLEEARASREGAWAAFERSRAQMALLEGAPPDSFAHVLASLSLEAPFAGIVQRLHVSPGELVTAGTPLLEVDRIDPVWIRVPVYPGDLVSFDTGSGALVHGLSARADETPLEARPVTAPLTADPAAVTADLFFQVANPGARLRPGQRVAVTLMLRAEQERPVIPYSAVLYDMYGGAWVYARTAEHVYTRMKVALEYTQGGLAVLSHGPPAGTRVVITGAAELFGTEFGVGK